MTSNPVFTGFTGFTGCLRLCLRRPVRRRHLAQVFNDVGVNGRSDIGLPWHGWPTTPCHRDRLYRTAAVLAFGAHLRAQTRTRCPTLAQESRCERLAVGPLRRSVKVLVHREPSSRLVEEADDVANLECVAVSLWPSAAKNKRIIPIHEDIGGNDELLMPPKIDVCSRARS